MLLSEYDMECLQKAKALIEKDLARHYSIAQLALHCGMGATKLKLAFKQQYGHALFAYLRRQRMLQAAALLLHSSHTIKQIARTTGFRYTTNFSAAFTAFYKMPPATYRNTNRIK
jgi:transcriptional regulator GlxA family with amidase domain